MSVPLWVRTISVVTIGCWLSLAGGGLYASTDPALCSDRSEFVESGWQEQQVKDAMDLYLREHRMRINWQQEPRPPSAIGRGYYEWLWQADIGATMKAELVARFCNE